VGSSVIPEALMTSHFPKNHRLRPLYRCLSFLAGGYCLIFGILGIAATRGDSLFSRAANRVFGLRTNLAFSVASIALGLVIVVVVVLGHNIDRTTEMVLGPLFLVVGLAMMGLVRTSANILNFGVSTCVVSFVIGLVLLSGAFYSEVGPPELARAEEDFRRSAPDPESQLRRHP
jgi:hypothetical protein